MLAWIATDHRRQALAVGLLYTALYLLTNGAVWTARQWLVRRSGPGLLRARRWPGWAALGQALSLILAIGFLLLALLGGAVAANDVGLGAVDWPAVWLWVLLPATGFALWLALLWRLQGRKKSAPAIVRRRGESNIIFLVLDALQQETTVALYRGALIPWLGSYWGIWLALVWAMLAARATPQINTRLQRPDQRALVLLAWAANGVGALLFLFSGSLWAALGGHILSRLAVQGVQHGLAAHRPKPATLADDQGQHDEGGEHGGSDDAQTLQIT